MTHETFSDIETSGFTGALAGGPAGNSRARNSPKASVHAATLSGARRRVNWSSSKCNGARSRNRGRDTRIFDLHHLRDITNGADIRREVIGTLKEQSTVGVKCEYRPVPLY